MNIELNFVADLTQPDMNIQSSKDSPKNSQTTSQDGEEETFSTLLNDSIKSHDDENSPTKSDTSENPKTEKAEKPEQAQVQTKTDDHNEDTGGIEGADNDLSLKDAAPASGRETEISNMAELAEVLELTEEQINMLAGLLGVTPEELSRVEITLSDQSNASGDERRSLQALMPDGSEIDLSDLLGIESKAIDESSVIKKTLGKMAEILNLSDSQADKLFSALKISSIEIKADSGNSLKARLTEQVDGFSTSPVKDAAKTQNENSKSGLNAKNENGKNAAAGIANENNPVAKKAGFNNILKQADDSTAAIEQAKPGLNAKTDSAVNVKTLSQVNTDTAVNNQSESAKAAASLSDSASPEKVRSSRIMGQIVEKASILSLPNRTHVRITLSPASLGTVEIKLTLQDAQIHGAIAVESAATKQIIEQNIQQLKDTLNEQGISIDEIDISLKHENTPSFEAQWAKDEARNYSNNDHSFNPASVEAEEDAAVDAAAIRKAMLNKIVDVKA